MVSDPVNAVFVACLFLHGVVSDPVIAVFVASWCGVGPSDCGVTQVIAVWDCILLCFVFLLMNRVAYISKR